MPNTNLASLPALVGALDGTEILMVEQAGVAKRATTAQFLPTRSIAFMNGIGAYTPAYSTTAPAGYVLLRPYIAGRAHTITELRATCVQGNSSSTAEPVIYSSNADGTVGPLLARGPTVTGHNLGQNVWPLTGTLNVASGQLLWIGFNVQVANLNNADNYNSSSAFWTQAVGLAPANPPASASISYTTRAWASWWPAGIA